MYTSCTYLLCEGHPDLMGDKEMLHALCDRRLAKIGKVGKIASCESFFPWTIKFRLVEQNSSTHNYSTNYSDISNSHIVLLGLGSK